MIYHGGVRGEATLFNELNLPMVRDWVLRFNAEDKRALIDRKPPVQPRLHSMTHRASLTAVIESGPIPAIHGVVRWRLCNMGQWLW